MTTPAVAPLFAEGLAKRLGTSIRHAARRLAIWEDVHGPSVVGTVSQRGSRRPRRFLTSHGLSLLLDIASSSTPARRGDLHERITCVEDELAATRRDVLALQRRLEGGSYVPTGDF